MAEENQIAEEPQAEQLLDLPEPPETVHYGVVIGGTVVNVIVVAVDGDEIEPPEGAELIEETEATGPASVNGTWDGTVFGPDPNAIPLA